MSRTIRLALIIICILVILPVPTVKMTGIGFDAAVDGGDNGGITNSLTFNSGNTSGTNLIGIIGCLGDNITGGVDDVTGGTWDGVAVSLIAKYTTPDIALDRSAYLYGIIGPATGVKSITINSTTNHYILCGAMTYNGVKQSGNPVENTQNAGGGGGLTTSLTTTVDNSWVIAIAQCGGCGASTGFTKRTGSVAFNNFMLGDSAGPISPQASYSMSTTGSVVGAIHILASIQPNTGSGSSCKPALTLLGVGGC